jgi:hypothetical protein
VNTLTASTALASTSVDGGTGENTNGVDGGRGDRKTAFEVGLERRKRVRSHGVCILEDVNYAADWVRTERRSRTPVTP